MGENIVKPRIDEARPAPEYVACKECAMWEECENKENRDGCYFGVKETNKDEAVDR